MFEYFQANPAHFILAAGVLGLLVGSFLNVVIYRLPVIMEREWRSQCADVLEAGECRADSDEAFNLIAPRSRCRECQRPIAAFHNIPVISYLILRGKCAACGAPISIRYPCVEALSGALACTVAWHFGFGVPALAAMLLTWALLALSFIDFDKQLLPDDITLPFLWLGLGFNVFGTFTTLEDSVVGAMAGYGILWGVYQAFRLATNKEGMGFGDFKLLAMLGAWLGWQVIPVIILLSSVVGAGIGIALIASRGHDRNVPIPFGPYLAVAGWLSLLWGQDMIRWYLG